jgi:AraC-like DNA-binding protein
VVAEFIQGHDVWLTPTLAMPLVPIGHITSTVDEPGVRRPPQSFIDRPEAGQLGGEVGAIARAVGYTSEYAFNRAFARTCGIAPGRYRTRHQAGPA